VKQLDRRFLGWEDFPDGLGEFEIRQFFTLSADELQAVRRRRRPLNRLGVALQIGRMRLTGTPMNSVQMIPQEVLGFLGDQIGIPAPRLASIRALYRRRRTLFEHQAAAKQALGLRDLPEHAERSLSGYLRREAGERHAIADLVTAARGWLADHLYLQLPSRRLKSLAVAARRHHHAQLLALIDSQVGTKQAGSWTEQLMETVDNGKARMDWLRDGPASRKSRGLADHVAKIAFLKRLKADRIDLAISTALLKAIARPMLYRKPATLRRMRGERTTLEIACFLRLQLLRLSDDGLALIDHRIADLWRQARTRAEIAVAAELRRHQQLVTSLVALADDPDTSAELLREQIRGLLLPFRASDSNPRSQVARVRRELATESRVSVELLKAASVIGLDVGPHHPLRGALATLEDVTAAGQRHLPKGTANPFGSTWAELIVQPDREAALGAFRAATLMLLKRSLRNGQASVSHSLEHRAPEDRLIPAARWSVERSRLLQDLAVTAKPQATIEWLRSELTAALTTLDAAVAAGDLRIENERLVVPRLKAADEDENLAALRRALFDQVGGAQLPELLIEIDAATRFSWILLGQPPRSEDELVVLYAAILALGSDITVAEIVRMTPGISESTTGEMMMRLEAGGRLREANRVILDHFRALPIAALWGAGLQASADMMSLDASHHLWSARLDPRRRSPAVGTYTHVLDQWAILHDQPIILNRRQAGAAIEGALRHEQIELERVAVDTHGFTHFAMALAKLVGFDLCPRLAQMNDRKLYLPRGLAVPDSLRPVVREVVSTKAIEKGWDPFLRIAASVKTGWCSATYVLDRFGSAARGDAAFQAGDAMGKLLRTRYFASYLGDLGFRTRIHALLSQGEAVHTLQRAIHAGPIGVRRGRTPEQLTAISAALTLLTNIVMTWNATRIGDIRRTAQDVFPDHQLRHVAPVAHGHINMRGTLKFDLTRHQQSLLGRAGRPGAHGAANIS
jgi:TnpA family transposase